MVRVSPACSMCPDGPCPQMEPVVAVGVHRSNSNHSSASGSAAGLVHRGAAGSEVSYNGMHQGARSDVSFNGPMHQVARSDLGYNNPAYGYPRSMANDMPYNGGGYAPSAEGGYYAAPHHPAYYGFPAAHPPVSNVGMLPNPYAASEPGMLPNPYAAAEPALSRGPTMRGYAPPSSPAPTHRAHQDAGVGYGHPGY
jgi:hypothetical protein